MLWQLLDFGVKDFKLIKVFKLTAYKVYFHPKACPKLAHAEEKGNQRRHGSIRNKIEMHFIQIYGHELSGANP